MKRILVQVQQAMLEEEKWTTPSMTYFRPHFMMPPAGNVNEAHDTTTNGASASAYAKLQRDHASNPWWLNYDQALDLQATQQNTVKPQHKAPPIVKHEQVDQARYGFDQINYSASQPSSLKTQKKTEEIFEV